MVRKVQEILNSINIAHILSHVSTVYAGVPIATRSMAYALSYIGMDVSIWATGEKRDEIEFKINGVPAHLYKAKWPSSWRRSFDLGRALANASKNIDIFHVHEVWSYPQYVAATIARKRGIPYILAPRASLEPWRMAYKGLKKNVYLELLGNTIIQNATCMHAVATAEEEGFRKVGYKGPVFIVHNGVVPEEFENLPNPVEAEMKWPILKGRRVVLYLSRLSPEKGLDKFIPAWSDIVKKPTYSDALLVLAGPDDRGYGLKVAEMIHKAGIDSNVLVPGMVEGRNKYALMSRADIFTLPSYSEGFSNALLENLAAGNPVLITPGCNFPEVAKVGAGLCVEPQRDALGEACSQLLDMPKDILINMGTNGRRLVMEKFTWPIAARKIATVYDAILNGKEIPLHPEPIPIDMKGKAVIH